MQLLNLKAEGVRNLHPFHLQFSPNFNLILGENGSGKTSLLETIHLLALARSFRSHLTSRAIQIGQEKFSIFGEVLQDDELITPLGIEKNLNGSMAIKISGETIQSLVELVRLLPVQIIHSESFSLLNDGPSSRRKFIDWGLFHVKPKFFSFWQKFQACLKQRNSAIRQHLSLKEIISWDDTLCEAAIEIERLRSDYIQQLIPIFSGLITNLLPNMEFNVHYRQGWPIDKNYKDVLCNAFNKDRQLGYTYWGPQRSDILIQYGSVLSHQILSRGQQKLVVTALMVAQGLLLKHQVEKRCIFLLDDLTSELDETKSSLLYQLLKSLEAQVFITAINLESFSQSISHNGEKVFHVERGIFREVSCE